MRVRLFGVLRSRLRREAVDVEVPAAGVTVERLLALLADQYAELAAWRGRTAVAVGVEVVGPSRRVRPGDDVSLLPPVSGGAR